MDTQQSETNQQTTSTGIRKYNAVRHGILVQVLTDDESIEADQIQRQFLDDYLPVTLTEELLIETMAIAYIRRQRAIKAEKDFMLQILNPTTWEEKITPALIPTPEGYDRDPMQEKRELIMTNVGHKAKIAQEEITIIESKYSRYITTCERQFYHALHELQRVQAIRTGVKPTSMAVDFVGKDE